MGCMFFLTCAGLLFGSWAVFPFLQREHERLPIWQAVLLWIGDATALGWFIYFFVTHSLLGRPLQQADRPGLVIATMLVALAVDLLITLNLMREERRLFQQASVVQGTVQTINTQELLETTRYHLTCSFQDRAGNNHETVFVVDYRRRLGSFIPNLPIHLAQPLRQKIVPFGMRISFVEDFPTRTWMTDLGWEHANSFHYFSLLILTFQGIGIGSFLMLAWNETRGRRRLPWWYDLHKPFPIMVEAAALALFGYLFAFL